MTKNNDPRQQMLGFTPRGETWTPPSHFPSLASAKMIAVDTETKDPYLLDRGISHRWGDGYIVGVSIATDNGFKGYYPVRHEGGGNLNEKAVFAWLKEELGRDNQPKIFANALYDLDWLRFHGIEVKGVIHDTHIAEPLIDNTLLFYNLESMGKKYLQMGKEGDEMNKWLATMYGGQPTRKDQGKNIWRAPASVVGRYAEQDALLPLLVFAEQRKRLEADNLLELYDIERRLLPMILAMRYRGVRVDIPRARELSGKMLGDTRGALQSVYDAAGREVNIYAADDIGAVCKTLGIKHPYTKTRLPSFTNNWMKNQGHPFIKALLEARTLAKISKDFIDTTILEYNINGRIHAQFHQLKSDDGGTITGRFSSSNPNLQNIPARSELGKDIRRLFIPEDGEEWVRLDYSQIEYRFLAHYAVGGGADDVRRMYNDHPETDFHEEVARLTGIDRKPAKNINFGLVYGMGRKKLAASLGKTLEEADEIFRIYHERAPFVKATFDLAARTAATRGWIKTILGRISRFNTWEKGEWSETWEPPLPYDQAMEKWGAIRRAETHKTLNKILQGSAADMMKKAMVDIWESGVCDVLGAPLVTVHDELGFSVPASKQGNDAWREVKHLMESAVKLKVPVLVDMERGSSWGDAR